MERDDLRRWFDDYLARFAACGRGHLVAEASERRIRVLAVHDPPAAGRAGHAA